MLDGCGQAALIMRLLSTERGRADILVEPPLSYARPFVASLHDAVSAFWVKRLRRGRRSILSFPGRSLAFTHAARRLASRADNRRGLAVSSPLGLILKASYCFCTHALMAHHYRSSQSSSAVCIVICRDFAATAARLCISLRPILLWLAPSGGGVFHGALLSLLKMRQADGQLSTPILATFTLRRFGKYARLIIASSSI